MSGDGSLDQGGGGVEGGSAMPSMDTHHLQTVEAAHLGRNDDQGNSLGGNQELSSEDSIQKAIDENFGKGVFISNENGRLKQWFKHSINYNEEDVRQFTDQTIQRLLASGDYVNVKEIQEKIEQKLQELRPKRIAILKGEVGIGFVPDELTQKVELANLSGQILRLEWMLDAVLSALTKNSEE